MTPSGTLAAVTAVAFFDLDKTVIAGSSALAFSRAFHRAGLVTRRAVVRSGYAQLLLLVAGADAGTMDRLRGSITALCAGWEVARVSEIVAETIDAVIGPLVYAEAAALIAGHRAAGDHVVVLTASGREVAEPVAALVGADACHSTRMGVARGRYTGEIDYWCYGDAKAGAAAAIAAERGVPLSASHAYSDSITDLPLLEAVGHPTVVNPDRALRRIATERHWPVLTFAAPGARLRPALAGVAVLALVAAGAGLANRRTRARVLDRYSP